MKERNKNFVQRRRDSSVCHRPDLASSNGNIARVKIYVYHDSYRNHLGGSIDTLSTDTTINQRREEHECKEVIRIRCSSYFRMRQGSKLFEFLNFFLSLFIFYLYLFSPPSHKRAHTHVHNDIHNSLGIRAIIRRIRRSKEGGSWS